MKDNPYIDYRFSPKEFSIVYNDHFRSYDKSWKKMELSYQMKNCYQNK